MESQRVPLTIYAINRIKTITEKFPESSFDLEYENHDDILYKLYLTIQINYRDVDGSFRVPIIDERDWDVPIIRDVIES